MFPVDDHENNNVYVDAAPNSQVRIVDEVSGYGNLGGYAARTIKFVVVGVRAIGFGVSGRDVVDKCCSCVRSDASAAVDRARHAARRTCAAVVV